MNDLMQNHKNQDLTLSEERKSYDELINYNITELQLAASFCRSSGNPGGVAVYCENRNKLNG